MLHRLSALSRPSYSLERTQRPRADARFVQTVVLHEGGLVYRAEGAERPGVYFEAPDGRPELLVADTEQHRMLRPRSAGPYVVVEACGQGMQALVFVRPGEAAVWVAGAAWALSGDAERALVADPGRGVWVQVELHGEDGPCAYDVAPLVFDSHEQLAPLVSLDSTGERALVMQVHLGRTDLVHLDIASGAREPVLEGLPEPSWVTGVFSPGGGLVVQQMALTAVPQYRLLRFSPGQSASELFRSAYVQPASRPAFIDRSWMVLPLSLKPHQLTGAGPVDLVAVPLGGGAQVQLTHTGDVRGWVEVEGEELRLVGGAEVRVWKRG